ncbi:MAG: hypothetical protein JSV05_09825 [Candidatus Bathyarchaeota archaeon]|nr:MAG: hypothetical protein JSV05_09825 [Candidatus Bathyarchaeota archaeon]
MKFIRFSTFEGVSFGVSNEDEIICLVTLAKTLKKSFPYNLEALIS